MIETNNYDINEQPVRFEKVTLMYHLKQDFAKISLPLKMVVSAVVLTLFLISGMIVSKSFQKKIPPPNTAKKVSQNITSPSPTGGPSGVVPTTPTIQGRLGEALQKVESLIPFLNTQNQTLKTANPSNPGTASSTSQVTGINPTKIPESSSNSPGITRGGGRGNGGGGNSGGGSGSGGDTSNWNSLTNASYGYSLKYPMGWVAEQTQLVGTTQSTNFHTISEPTKIVAIFYIREITNSVSASQKSSGSILQNMYQTKIYIGGSGRIFSYQCVPQSLDAIVSVCNSMEQTVVFTN